MRNLLATALAQGAPESAAAHVIDLLRERLQGRTPALVVVFASTSQPLWLVMPMFRSAFGGATVLGCSTAGEIVEDADAKQSLCAMAIAGDIQVFARLAKNVAEDPRGAIASAVADLPKSVPHHPFRCGLVLLDPLHGDAAALGRMAARALGMHDGFPVVGAAAGDDLALCGAQVALGDEVSEDAMVLATIHSARPLGVGVHHGYEPMSKVVTVTRSEHQLVREIDGQPAWNVWASLTEAAARREGIDPHALAGEELIAFLLRHQALVETDDGTEVLRAPLCRHEDGSIAFACSIEPGTRLRIARASAASQIESTRVAAERARAQLGDHEIAGALVFDSVARNLVLSERYIDGVTAMSDALEGAPLCGFQSYGEVAMTDNRAVFHNTSTVVLAFAR